MYNIGITGTRSGMNDTQKKNVTEFLRDSLKQHSLSTLHHGDCIGVDVEIANIAKSMGYYIINHPPTNSDLRAFHESNAYKKPLTYFARNRNIVDETDLLLVVPFQNFPQNSGGTWYTYDYAIKNKKNYMIFYPDGRIHT